VALCLITTVCHRQWYTTGWSPITYLLIKYLRELLSKLELTHIRCHIDNVIINTLVHTYNYALFASSWRAMQSLIDVVYIESANINISRNAQKSVDMIFRPKNRNKITNTVHLNFMLGSFALIVSEFRN